MTTATPAKHRPIHSVLQKLIKMKLLDQFFLHIIIISLSVYVYRISCKPHSVCWQSETLNCAMRVRVCARSFARIWCILNVKHFFIIPYLYCHFPLLTHAFVSKLMHSWCVCVCQSHTSDDVMCMWLVSKLVFFLHETRLGTRTLVVISARRKCAHLVWYTHVHEWAWISVSFYVQRKKCVHHLHDFRKMNTHFVRAVLIRQCISSWYCLDKCIGVLCNFQGFSEKWKRTKNVVWQNLSDVT